MAFTEDLGAFVDPEDFAVPAIFGDKVGFVQKDEGDGEILGDRVQSTKHSIIFRTADFPGLKHGSWIEVGGKQFSVITAPRRIDDGAFSTVDLQTP